MKKFVNDPKNFVPRDAGGARARQPRHLGVRPRVQPDHAGRRPERRQGVDHPGLRVRPRAGPRDDGRPGHARRGLPRRRLRRASDRLRLRDHQADELGQGRACCWSTTTPATGWRSTWRRSWPRPRTSTSETLFIDDDVAVQDSTYTVGRRGVAGNFFVMKAVGAASEKGADLDELVRIGEKVNSVTRTMGMALTACTPPAKGSPLFDLPDDEIEMGVGIHGEPGRRREKLRLGERDRRRAARGRRRRPAVRVRRPGRADGQRARRHADQRAVPRATGAPTSRLADRGIDDRAQLRRRVLHVARHGRVLDHPGRARRRDRGPARTSPPRSPSASSDLLLAG